MKYTVKGKDGSGRTALGEREAAPPIKRLFVVQKIRSCPIFQITYRHINYKQKSI